LVRKQRKVDKPSKASSIKALLAGITKEMAQPRIAESAQADGDRHGAAKRKKPA
jgi:hypothetical protein